LTVSCWIRNNGGLYYSRSEEKAMKADPIFADIERHRRLEHVASTPDEDAVDRRCKVADQALARLMKAKPASKAGAIALADHILALDEGAHSAVLRQTLVTIADAFRA